MNRNWCSLRDWYSVLQSNVLPLYEYLCALAADAAGAASFLLRVPFWWLASCLCQWHDVKLVRGLPAVPVGLAATGLVYFIGVTHARADRDSWYRSRAEAAMAAKDFRSAPFAWNV